MVSQLWARFLRWCYLLAWGMWRGECAVSTWTEDGKLVALWTSTHDYEHQILWWEAQ